MKYFSSYLTTVTEKLVSVDISNSRWFRHLWLFYLMEIWVLKCHELESFCFVPKHSDLVKNKRFGALSNSPLTHFIDDFTPSNILTGLTWGQLCSCETNFNCFACSLTIWIAILTIICFFFLYACSHYGRRRRNFKSMKRLFGSLGRFQVLS